MHAMGKTILKYGLALIAALFMFKVIEYYYFSQIITIEFYLGIVAVLFLALGAFLANKLAGRAGAVDEAGNGGKPKVNEPKGVQAGSLSKREHEVLTLIAEGCSNQEIAERLHGSLNTIKTHTANIFVKLGVKRRTQAVSKAKAIGVLPSA